jgi:hypothetical protein
MALPGVQRGLIARGAICATLAVRLGTRGRTPSTSAVFKGLMIRSDSDRGARPPVALRGKPWAVHPVVLVGTLQETLIDGILVPTRKSFTRFHLGLSPQAHHLAVTGSRRSW